VRPNLLRFSGRRSSSMLDGPVRWWVVGSSKECGRRDMWS
jgi:hypothetical protein